MSTSKLVRARVLRDVPSHQLPAGALVEASAALIKALASDGSVDPHKDAVAYAVEQGAPVVRSSLELAAEARAEQVAKLQADLQAAEAAYNAAQGDEAKAAALQALTDANAALQALTA